MKYVELARRLGLEAESQTVIGKDLLAMIHTQVQYAMTRHPKAIVFDGQLAFQRETFWTHWLHNHTVFALQRYFYSVGIPFVIVPIQVN